MKGAHRDDADQWITLQRAARLAGLGWLSAFRRCVLNEWRCEETEPGVWRVHVSAVPAAREKRKREGAAR